MAPPEAPLLLSHLSLLQPEGTVGHWPHPVRGGVVLPSLVRRYDVGRFTVEEIVAPIFVPGGPLAGAEWL